MKLDVCNEITSMSLIDKTIALLQPCMCLPGVIIIVILQPFEINFENCLAQQYFKNPYRNLFQSSSVLAIFVLLKCPFTVLRGYFYISPNLMVISHA